MKFCPTRPGSSVGRAEDWKSSCRWFNSTPGHQTPCFIRSFNYTPSLQSFTQFYLSYTHSIHCFTYTIECVFREWKHNRKYEANALLQRRVLLRRSRRVPMERWQLSKSKIELSMMTMERVLLCCFKEKIANAGNVEYAETQVLGLTTAQSRQT